MNDALAVLEPAMYVIKLRLRLLSLTAVMSAGLWNTSDGSSSTMVMLSPPSAAAWALTGRRRKLKAVWLSCPSARVAAKAHSKAKTTFFIPLSYFVGKVTPFFKYLSYFCSCKRCHYCFITLNGIDYYAADGHKEDERG